MWFDSHVSRCIPQVLGRILAWLASNNVYASLPFTPRWQFSCSELSLLRRSGCDHSPFALHNKINTDVQRVSPDMKSPFRSTRSWQTRINSARKAVIVSCVCDRNLSIIIRERRRGRSSLIEKYAHRVREISNSKIPAIHKYFYEFIFIWYLECAILYVNMSRAENRGSVIRKKDKWRLCIIADISRCTLHKRTIKVKFYDSKSSMSIPSVHQVVSISVSRCIVFSIISTVYPAVVTTESLLLSRSSAFRVTWIRLQRE